MDAQDRPPFQYRSTSFGMVNTKSYHKIPTKMGSYDQNSFEARARYVARHTERDGRKNSVDVV